MWQLTVTSGEDGSMMQPTVRLRMHEDKPRQDYHNPKIRTAAYYRVAVNSNIKHVFPGWQTARVQDTQNAFVLLSA